MLCNPACIFNFNGHNAVTKSAQSRPISTIRCDIICDICDCNTSAFHCGIKVYIPRETIINTVFKLWQSVAMQYFKRCEKTKAIHRESGQLIAFYEWENVEVQIEILNVKKTRDLSTGFFILN